MSKTTSTSAFGGRSGGRSRGDHLEVLPFRPHRSRKVQFLLWVGRWAGELLLLAGLITLVVLLHRNGLTLLWATATVVAAVTVPFVIPRTRAVLMPLVWVSIVRHRMRAYFIECRVFNRSGKLPWILFVRPTPVGERAWIWLIPGLSLRDFEDDTDQIAVACWARTTRVERHKSIAALIRLDIIRRDPLTTTDALPSTLIPPDATTAEDNQGNTGMGPLHLPRQVIDLTRRATSGKNTNKTAKATKATSDNTDTGQDAGGSDPSVTTRGGEDVTDYV